MDIDLLRRLAGEGAPTEADVDALAAVKANDFETDDSESNFERVDLPALSNEQIAALVSPEAILKVIEFEVTSRAVYERKYVRAIKPGADSGVTIGIGYDLGYNSEAQVRADLAGLLSPTEIDALVGCCGLTHGQAAAARERVQNVVLPWDDALTLFQRSTVPRFGQMVRQTFPRADETAGHAFGALFSLVYNRGASLKGERRRHMRAIRDLIAAGKFDEVPAQFRDMASIWANDPSVAGVVKRRKIEATLFEAGLAQMAERRRTAAAVAATAGGGAAAGTDRDAALAAYHDGDGATYEEEPDRHLESVDPAQAKVAWPADENAPDYAHLRDRSLSGTTFQFGPTELELLIHANGFRPQTAGGRMVFALRGAELVTPGEASTVMMRQEDRPQLTLREVRPDHRTFKCVIGVYDIARERLSAYTASTVPNPKAVASHVAGRSPANMMLTGCYEFVVGWHQLSRAEKKIPGCLIEAGRQKAVLRTRKDHGFDTTDEVDNSTPCGDNLHPGKGEASYPFSSWGCLVVAGSVDPVRDGDRASVRATGEWANFRKALGFAPTGTTEHGRILSVVLLTGLEAAIARDLVARQVAPSDMVDALHRIRQGSTGPQAKALRAALNLPTGDVFDHAAVKALADLQRRTTGRNDGIYSPALDRASGLGVFTAPSIVVAQRESVRGGGGGDGNAGAALARLEAELDFELGYHHEAMRGGERESLRGVVDGVMTAVGTVVASGSAALQGVGRGLRQEAERTLRAHICGADGTVNADLRRRIDEAGALGTVGVRRAMVYGIRQLPGLALLPHDTLERLADYLVAKTIAPLVDATTGRIAGGVDGLCAAWCGTAEPVPGPTGGPGSDIQAVPPGQPATPSGPIVPQPESSPKVTEAERILALAEAAAAGAEPDVHGARYYIRRLQDHLHTTGEQLPAEAGRRLMALMCDTRLLDNLDGSRVDIYAIFAKIEQVAGDPTRRSELDRHLDTAWQVLGDARKRVCAKAAERVVKALRKHRLHAELTRLADRLLTRDTVKLMRDEPMLPVVGPYYGLSLVDMDRIEAGRVVLETLLEKHGADLTAKQIAEVTGNLGRSYKQLYVNHVTTASDAVALATTHGPYLTKSIEYYRRIYDPTKPDANYWHGINYVALLDRARRDRLTVDGHGETRDLARGIVDALVPKATSAEGQGDHWLHATLGEAYVALGDHDNAAKHYGEFALHQNTDAFALNSAIRQLEQVWQIEGGADPRGAIVTQLKRVLLEKEGGKASFSPRERAAIAASTAEQMPHQIHFERHLERRTKTGRYLPFAMVQMMNQQGIAVAAIKEPQPHMGEYAPPGPTIGTGFLVDGRDFGIDEPGKSFVLTNAHVVWDADKAGGKREDKALRPDEARIAFEGSDGGRVVYRVTAVRWQSESTRHDAALLELDRRVVDQRGDDVRPVKLSAKDTLTVATGDNRGTMLCIIGHPLGGGLTVATSGSLGDMIAALLDKGAPANANEPEYLHYNVSTDEGNSGSPVFDAATWEVVGLHHEGFDPHHGRPRLGGKPGRHHANQGVRMLCIVKAAREELGAKPKRRTLRERLVRKRP